MTPEEVHADFHDRILKYVQDAEAHMGLPADTIGNTWRDTDFLFVVKMCAVIEPLLKEAVREHVRRNLSIFTPFSPAKSETLIKEIGKFDVDTLRKILVELEAIQQWLSNFIGALFQVRHRYAHRISNGHLTVPEICEKIAGDGGDAKLFDKLVALSEPRPAGEVAAPLLRLFMFYNVALFLQVAVHMAKPPPPPPTGGILGALLRNRGPAEGASEDAESQD